MAVTDQRAPPAQQLRMSAREMASLGERIQSLHDEICRFEPGVERMACALYDADLDLLRTFVNSTHKGKPLTAYEYKLSQSPSLLRMAQSGQSRVLHDIPVDLDSQTEHSRWLLAQGFRSSYTMPLFVKGAFEGFLFFDSTQAGLFRPEVTSLLGVYGRLVGLMITHETAAVRSLVGSVRIAREFAHLRDLETSTHLERMSRYCRVMARRMAASHGLSDEFAEHLFLFSSLHDIGKIGVPDSILRKQGSFTPDERTQMQRHVLLGSEIVERLVGDFALDGLASLSILRNLVACHHEYLDGSGYPRGLRAEQIPIEARITTVADIFDALTSQRVYKPNWSVEDAHARLDRMVGEGKLDGACVQALKSAAPQVLEILQRYTEE